ncbi:hypothetical protein THAOC_01127, partial [Thalassiosira oceanica]
AAGKHHEHVWPPHLPSQHPIVQRKSKRSAMPASSQAGTLNIQRIYSAMDPFQENFDSTRFLFLCRKERLVRIPTPVHEDRSSVPLPHVGEDAAAAATDAASRTDASGTTFSICTWNIRSGRNGGLESACRALDLSNVAVAVLQETKITTDAYTKFSSGYRVQASKATSVRQGGVALCYRDDHPDFELEEQRFFGPNVVTFRLITGGAKYYCVGAYIPPPTTPR